jgi:hypothetical protein
LGWQGSPFVMHAVHDAVVFGSTQSAEEPPDDEVEEPELEELEPLPPDELEEPELEELELEPVPPDDELDEPELEDVELEP